MNENAIPSAPDDVVRVFVSYARENREMPRIAERARLGQMIVVPVLVEPCDWSEYPFLADRQMVPSSPLIDYTESEPQWAKVRFQILDGLKAQLKRIREAPQMHTAPAAALNAHDAPPEETIIEADAIPSSQPGPWQQDARPRSAGGGKRSWAISAGRKPQGSRPGRKRNAARPISSAAEGLKGKPRRDMKILLTRKRSRP